MSTFTIVTRASLLARLQRVPPEAQREFVSTCLPVLAQHVSFYAKSLDADEIAAAVIEQFVLTPIRYDPTKKFGRLMTVCVRRRWLDLLKGRKREGTMPGDYFDGVPDDIPDISEDELLPAEIWDAVNAVRRDFCCTTVTSSFSSTTRACRRSRSRACYG